MRCTLREWRLSDAKDLAETALLGMSRKVCKFLG